MNVSRYLTVFLSLLIFAACAEKSDSEKKEDSPDKVESTNQLSTQDEIENGLEANNEIPYVIEDSSRVVNLEGGIQLFIIEEGGGPIPKPGSNVIIDYHGTLLDGSVFDSSFDKGGYQDFQLTQLIKGWQIGLTAVNSGSKIKLIVPPEMGYGAADKPGIPANSTLVFDIHLVSTY